MKTYFTCPVCGKPLEQTEKSFVCADRHTFDTAAEGYVNLAPPRKDADRSGDAADSCKARRRFLETGAYEPLANALCEAFASFGTLSPGDLIVDAGCGEGYYARFVKNRFPQAEVYGLDLAKSAVKMAAKAEKNKDMSAKSHFAVAGIFDLPFADESTAAVLSVFAPVADQENRRVLKPGGLLAVACPGRQHLFGIKERLYETALENEEKTPLYEGFSLVAEKHVCYEMTLSGEQAADLFAMTPYFWRSTAEVREKSVNLGQTVTKADFLVKIYRKDACGFDH